MALAQPLKHRCATGSSTGTSWPVQQRLGTCSSRCRRRAVQAQALPDFLKDFFDFNNWAPKSTRVWRLQQWEPGQNNSPTEADSMGADSIQTLNERISQMRSTSSSTSSSASRPSDASGGGLQTLDPESTLGPAERSFSDASDDDVAAALASRLRGVQLSPGASSEASAAGQQPEPLTGEEIRQLLLVKYGKSYDMSFVRRDMPGKTFVSLNIMWLHLEQKSFKMTAEQYIDKLDGVGALVAALGQTDKVRRFLKAPARSQKGLPRRPVVGTAISIQFDLPQPVIEEWFGTRGGL